MNYEVKRLAGTTRLGNAPAKSVLLYLVEVADETGFGWPSVELIAGVTELNMRSILRIVQVFQEIGLVEKIKGDRPHTPFRYAFQLKLSMLGKNLATIFEESYLRAQGKSVSETVCENVSETVKNVSETVKNVSETVKSVSETFPPHPLYGRTVKEQSQNNPLTPASGGDGGGFEGASERERRKADHKAAVERALAKIKQACGFERRRVLRMVVAQIERQCDKGEDPHAVAIAMIEAWKDQAALFREGVLRVVYGAESFIGDGIWNNRDLWLWDLKAIERNSNRNVGVYRGVG